MPTMYTFVFGNRIYNFVIITYTFVSHPADLLILIIRIKRQILRSVGGAVVLRRHTKPLVKLLVEV